MINMNGYKVIYENEVFNCLAISMMMFPDMNEPHGIISKGLLIDVLIINKDGQIVTIREDSNKFQFIREVKS